MILLNDRVVIKGSLYMPRVGTWVADLSVDSKDDLTGAVTLQTSDGKFSLKGTVVNHGVFTNTLRVRVYGGNAGLSKPVGPKFYRQVPLKVPLQDILSECGESLSSTSDSAVTSYQLAFWTRETSTGIRAVKRLLENQPASYRVLADGTFWVGTDTYPPAASAEYIVMDRSDSKQFELIASENPFLFPGTTFNNERVSVVRHIFEQSSFRTRVWYEPK